MLEVLALVQVIQIVEVLVEELLVLRLLLLVEVEVVVDQVLQHQLQEMVMMDLQIPAAVVEVQMDILQVLHLLVVDLVDQV